VEAHLLEVIRVRVRARVRVRDRLTGLGLGLHTSLMWPSRVLHWYLASG
jgi:hypothetical protein